MGGWFHIYTLHCCCSTSFESVQVVVDLKDHRFIWNESGPSVHASLGFCLGYCFSTTC